MADENLHFQKRTNFFVKVQCSVLELWNFFLSGGSLIQKIRQMKASKDNKYDVIETSSLVQVCMYEICSEAAIQCLTIAIVFELIYL